MNNEEIENYEVNAEISIYREYRDVINLFNYLVETERRTYLANGVDLQVHNNGGETYFELVLTDAWVWDPYRTRRVVKSIRVLTYKDVNVEELSKQDVTDISNL